MLLSALAPARWAAGALLAVAAAGLLAMLLLDRGPHGCRSASRAVDNAGDATRSTDDDAHG